MTEYQFIGIDTYKNCGIITLNRPQVLNAINVTMVQELAEQIYNFESDENIKTIIIKGNEKAFAAGIDTKEMFSTLEEEVFDIENYNTVFTVLQNCQKPIIAEVSGFALGIGFEIALACDIILASDNAKFGQPEISLGIIPGFGAISRLLKFAGKAPMMDIVMSGKSLSAEEAFSLGLISRIVPLNILHNETLKLAEKIGNMPDTALSAIKNCCNFACKNPLNGGIEYERLMAKNLSESYEFKENLKKFLTKA